jgi:hypothetical protein
MLHINDYTEKEERTTFYNANEMRVINKKNKDIVGKMQKNVSIDETDEFCTRGLERYVRETAKLRNGQKRAAISAVLAQEYMLDEDEIIEDMPTDESIALVYSSLTGASTISAYRMGLADAKAVQEEEEEDNVQQPQGKSKAQQESNKITSCRRMVMMRMREQNSPCVPSQVVNSAA